MKHYFLGRTRATHIQFARYFFVGGSAALIDFFLFALLTRYAGMHYLEAAFIAYTFGLIWNYYLSLIWIFESRRGRAAELSMVIAIAVGGVLLTELLLWAFVANAGMDPIPAKIIVLWIVLIWNFGMRKAYVFH